MLCTASEPQSMKLDMQLYGVSNLQVVDSLCSYQMCTDSRLIIGISRLVLWYRLIVVFALCGLHVAEVKFMYASMYVI